MQFLKANAGKIAAVLVIFAAAGLLAWWNSGSADPTRGLPAEIRYVDVTTGEFYAFDRGEAVELPRANPDTGERTLVPVYEQDGAVFISRRRSHVLQQLGPKNKWVDTETLRVREPEG